MFHTFGRKVKVSSFHRCKIFMFATLEVSWKNAIVHTKMMSYQGFYSFIFCYRKRKALADHLNQCKVGVNDRGVDSFM